MTIDRIGPPDPIQPGKKPGRNDVVRERGQADSISLSSEAMEKSGLYHTIEVVSAAPDLRMDRIAELKAKINDPEYLNDMVINATADKIIESFGL
ncbi:MAG: flagellar biosynthesis anti-sigma factor FlgM [Treponema sp.]|jgi:negative regulator of flagellin synthesis FlgM|nr:flagellar biosynthesis anti-sigma factor FlgM [Treponema sp.]